jgi:N-acetylmuramoyl-L-alanine amidase
MKRWSIPATGVIGHSDMAPGRKIDPGSRFDWVRLARQKLAGHSCSKNPALPPNADLFCKLACAAGYPQDADFETLLGTVRLRFRPWANGPLDGADMALFPGQTL